MCHADTPTFGNPWDQRGHRKMQASCGCRDDEEVGEGSSGRGHRLQAESPSQPVPQAREGAWENGHTAKGTCLYCRSARS